MSEHPFEYRLGPRPMDVAVRLASGWIRMANAKRLTDQDVAEWSVLAAAQPSTGDAPEIGRVRDAIGEDAEYFEGTVLNRQKLKGDYYAKGYDEAMAKMQRRLDEIQQGALTSHQRSEARIAELEQAHEALLGQAQQVREHVDQAEAAAAGYTPESGSFTLKEMVEAVEKGAYNRGYDNARKEHEVEGHPPPLAKPGKLSADDMRQMLLTEFGNALLALGTEKGITMRAAATIAGLTTRPEYTTRFGTDLVKRGWVQIVPGAKDGRSMVLRITDRGVAELRQVGRK